MGLVAICENEMLRELIKVYTWMVVIKQLQATQTSDAYCTYASTDASRVGGVGATSIDKKEEMSVGHVGGMDVSWPCWGQ